MKVHSDRPELVQPGAFVRPAGAQLRNAPNSASLADVWHEVGPCLAYPKSDGWRIQIHKVGGVVRLYSRSGKDWGPDYPALVRLITSSISADSVILDSEVVGFDRGGKWLPPAKLRRAEILRCYVLDMLLFEASDLTLLSTTERVKFMREALKDALSSDFQLAEYTDIASFEQLTALYEACQARRREGFDGTIIKRHNAPYFTDVLKVKPEDTLDAVVVGAYLNPVGAVKSLLLAVLDEERQRWVPVAKVARSSTDWNAVWPACQAEITDQFPDVLEPPPDKPDLWLRPSVVVQVSVTTLLPGKGYLVRAEYARECTLREDKGPGEASEFSQVLALAGLGRDTRTVPEQPDVMQMRLFE